MPPDLQTLLAIGALIIITYRYSLIPVWITVHYNVHIGQAIPTVTGLVCFLRVNTLAIFVRLVSRTSTA